MKTLGLVAALCICAVGYGQVQKLSFKEAVKIAIDNNVNLRQAKNTLGGFEADRRAAYGSLAPDVTGYLQAWRNDGNFFIQQEARVVNTVSDNLYGSIDADVMIFNGLKQCLEALSLKIILKHL